MMFDVTIEREIGGGETELKEYVGVSKLINIPSMAKVKLSYPNGDSDMSPCGQVVRVTPHETPDGEAN